LGLALKGIDIVINDGCSPSLMNMMKEIYTALSGLRVSWLCHFIGLHPMLMYYTPLGQLKETV